MTVEHRCMIMVVLRWLAVFPTACGAALLVLSAFGGISLLDSESYMWPNWLWTMLLSASGALAAIGWVALGTLVAPTHKNIIRWLLSATGSVTAVWLLYPLFSSDVLQTTIVLGVTVAAGALTALLFTNGT